jgi:hypothetical protein
MPTAWQKFLPYFTIYLEFSMVFQTYLFISRFLADPLTMLLRNPGWEKLMYTDPLSCFYDYNENVLRLLRTAMMIVNCVRSGTQPKLSLTRHKFVSFSSVPQHHHPSNSTNTVYT